MRKKIKIPSKVFMVLLMIFFYLPIIYTIVFFF